MGMNRDAHNVGVRESRETSDSPGIGEEKTKKENARGGR